MRGGVVHVRGEPDDVADSGALDGAEKTGDLVLAPVGRPIAERNSIETDEADRQISGDDLPRCPRGRDLPLQPGELLGTEDPAAVIAALVPAVIAIAAHVDHEDVEQRTVADAAVDPALLRADIADRHEVKEGAAGARDQARVPSSS